MNNPEGPCTGTNSCFRDGEHRWEYFGTQQGEEWERCMDCGESRLARYHDVGSGDDMNDLSNVKVAGGWSAQRERFSLVALAVLDIAIGHRRGMVRLPLAAIRGHRFNNDNDILTRLESRFTEAQFMECPGSSIDAALIDAAQSDRWYEREKRYDDKYYGDDGETEIVGEDGQE